MARSGLYKTDVQRARDALLAQGKRPSVDAVRVALGNTGSKTTIHRYLRELEEEVGVRADELRYLGCLYSSPGFCTEKLHMYLAQGLHRGESHPDEDEFLERLELPFEELIRQIMAGEISDAKTVATALKVKVLLDL